MLLTPKPHFGFTSINFKRICFLHIYDKRDNLDFDIVNFPVLDGSTSYAVYTSQLIQFPRVSSHVTDFNALNKILTGKLIHKDYRYHKL